MKQVSPRSRQVKARRARHLGSLAAAWLFVWSGGITVLCAREFPPQASPALTQAQIGAAFVFNFAKFTEWPQQAFADAASPLSVCFLGADDVRSAFQSLSAGKAVSGRFVVVREVKSASDIHDCQIVYTDSPNINILSGVLKSARQCSALAIGTADEFLVRGGMIKLVVENNRMRFDVNVGAAGRTKIRLSSKLLALARSVVDLPDPAGS